MKQLGKFFIIILVFMVFFPCSSCWSKDASQPTHPQIVTAAGSGVNLGITRLLGEAFSKQNNKVTINVPGSIGSRGAIKAVADGAIVLGLISRPLKEKEKAMGIVERPYAQVAIVVGAHSGVKDDAITSQELIAVFRGTKTRWKDGNTIIVQAREKSDSGFMILQNKIPGFREAYVESYKAKRWTLYYNDQDANQALANIPFGIGVTGLGMIMTENLNVKVLKLDGIAPDQENVINGTYPLSRQLFFIYRPGTLSGAEKMFLDFVASETGRGVLQANGYIPLM